MPNAHGRLGVAKGTLGVARSVGREDRLLLDTTVSGVNPPATIPEKTSVPGPFDVRHHPQEHPDDGTLALVINVSQAHKRVRLSHAGKGPYAFRAGGSSVFSGLSSWRHVLRLLVETHRRPDHWHLP